MIVILQYNTNVILILCVYSMNIGNNVIASKTMCNYYLPVGDDWVRKL